MKQYTQPTMTVSVIANPNVFTASIDVPGDNDTWDDEDDADPNDAVLN
ncbi:MAG: hypothetical protein IJC17_05620 [Clostridia bacterium]|nr:hypothetical protein [Clostridia bacterium]